MADPAPNPSSLAQPFNFRRWIDEHRHLLKPPVGNKEVFRDGEFIVMVVGGPNARTDFHVDPGPELFYQLEGDMRLRTLQHGRIVDLTIREGDIFLLPSNMPHSPQRQANTVGLVVERKRFAGERDGLQWYCDNCATLLYEQFLELTDIETQFPPIFQRFYGDTSLHRCRQCGEVARLPPGKGS